MEPAPTANGLQYQPYAPFHGTGHKPAGTPDLYIASKNLPKGMAVMVDERFRLPKVEKRGCFNNDGGRIPVVTTNLRDLDEEWRTNLQHRKAHPCLASPLWELRAKRH